MELWCFDLDWDRDQKPDREAEEAGSGSRLPSDFPSPETAMDAPVAPQSYWGPLRYNPWVCGYTR
jgi:hypothetical protein